MKREKTIALALVLILAISALTTTALAASAESGTDTETTTGETQTTHRHSSKPSGKQQTAEPEGAIGKDAAKTKALEDAGVTADQVTRLKSRVTKLDDGTVIYKVKFTYDGQRYSYQIDALTGDVIDKSSAAATDSEASFRGSDASGGTQETSEAEATV